LPSAVVPQDLAHPTQVVGVRLRIIIIINSSRNNYHDNSSREEEKAGGQTDQHSEGRKGSGI